MATIYFDEAGNTGSDLLNKMQTIYVLCSSIIQEDEAKEIIEKYFGKNKKIHFKDLKESVSDRHKIIKLLRDNETLFKEKFKTCYYHKKYFIACQMLNYLYEPQLYDTGIDYFDGGINIAHANMFYICSYAFCGEKRMDKVLKSFVKMIKIKDNNKMDTNQINEYYKALEDAMKNCLRDELKTDFYTLLETENDILSYLDNVDKYALDPASHALIELVGQWTKELNGSINIIHDRSTSTNESKKYLEILANIVTEPVDIGYGEYKTRLPLKVNSFKFESSELSNSIQLCDLVASSIFFINNGKEGIDKIAFKEELTQTIKSWNTFGSVYPTSDVSFDPKRKKQMGDINSIDYLMYKIET
ncbi:MAG: DUF3800 domain-containing protein [Fibromonadaceae bacterium]|jgi:hypothetical protein|nr:DUF3800 domain-containing protein [Fibromonadaceae bacterium]